MHPMRHRQAVRQRTLTPPSQVRLLLAQLEAPRTGARKGLRAGAFLRPLCWVIPAQRTAAAQRVQYRRNSELAARHNAPVFASGHMPRKLAKRKKARGEGVSVVRLCAEMGSPSSVRFQHAKRAFPMVAGKALLCIVCLRLLWERDQSSSSAPVYSW